MEHNKIGWRALSAPQGTHLLFFYRIFPTIEKGINELWKIAPEIQRIMDPDQSSQKGILGSMFQKRNIVVEDILSHLAHTVFQKRKNRYIHEPKITLEPGWFEYDTGDMDFGWIDITHGDFSQHDRRGEAYLVYVHIHTSVTSDITKEMQNMAQAMYYAKWKYAEEEEAYAPLLVCIIGRQKSKTSALKDSGNAYTLPTSNSEHQALPGDTQQRALPGEKPLALPPPDDNNE